MLWVLFTDDPLPLPFLPVESDTPSQTWFLAGILYFLITAVPLFILLRVFLSRRLAIVQRAFKDLGQLDIASMAPGGILSAEVPGDAIYVNERAAKLIGRPVEDCLGKGWQSAVHEDDRDRLLVALQKTTETGESLAEEFRWRHPDGTVIWVLGTVIPQYDDQGRIKCFLGMLTDISRRKAMEQALNEAQERLKTAVSAAQVGLWDWNLRNDKVYYSPEWKRQIGYEDDEIGDSFEEWRSRVHPDDLERTEANARRVAEKGGADLKAEFRFLHKDGSYRWILTQGAVIHGADGEPERLLGSHVDITDRKLAELELQRGLNKYEDLAELSPIGIYYADAERGVTYNNQTIKQLTGIEDEEEILGYNWLDFVLEDDRGWITEFVQTRNRQPREFSYEYRIRSRDGRIHWVTEVGRPVFDSMGRLSGYIGTLTDVTPLKETVDELHRSESFRRLIIELEPDCVKVLAPNGALVEMNPAGLKMIDADSLDVVKGKRMADMVVPEHRDEFIALHREVMNGGSGKLAFDIVSLKGVRRHLETHAVPLLEEGRVVGLLGVTRDVTEQRQAEEAIRESEIRYRELFETNPVPMCVWDPETFEFLDVNNAMIAHYGYSREELLSMSVMDIRPPEDIPKLMQTMDAASRGRFAAGIFRHIRKNGDILEVNVASHPIRFGNRMARFAQMVDVTEQRRAEAALEQERLELHETSRRLNHILETSPSLVFSVRVQQDKFTLLWVSDNIERILGYSREEAYLPYWWQNNIHPDERDRAVSDAVQAFREGDHLLDEFRFRKQGGDYIWIRVEARQVDGDDESGIEIVGTWSDITEEHEARERLRLDAAAFESTRDGVLIADSEARIISVNRALLRVSGYPEKELLGRDTRVFQSGRHDRDFYRNLWNSLEKLGYWQGEIWNRDKSGEVFPVWLTISSVYNERNELTHYVAIYTDISQLKQSEEELHKLAHYDPLTGLPNRLLLQSRLEHAIEQAHRRNNMVAVLFLDLDDFKKINDSLGHVVGDELLSETAGRLGERVREADTLARLGGDEFVVLLESLEESQDVANLARDLLSSLAIPFKLPSTHELHVHGSIGISIFPDDGGTPEELLRAADTAMYRAKEEGGDRYMFYTMEMSQEVVSSLELENALRQGLARNEFELYFQPTRHLQTGSIRSAEALLRWNSRHIGPVSPAEFIPVAERSGLIVPIGAWVIEAACRQLAEWRDLGLPAMSIAVNVSARQFRSPELVASIEEALQRHNLSPQNLILELTESMLMERPAEAAETLAHLKELGVRRALDDFGTGFSSLAYLTRFPVDTLKIDGSFVQGIETDPSARQIITAIIELAHNLGMETVAEGVETPAQESFLRDLGCTLIQGFLLSEPLPAADFTRFIHAQNGPAADAV